MPETEKRSWWRDLFRKEVVAGHVVNSLVAIAVSSVFGLIVTIAWLFWAAWRGSFLWTQRLIGASIAFAVFSIIVAINVQITRRRIQPIRPVAAKGYLDHKADSARGRDEITRVLNEITAITLQETEGIKAGTARLERIFTRPSDAKRLAMEIAEARRSARRSDKTTGKLAKKVPLLANATETYSHAELAFWAWFTANHPIEGTEAQARIKIIEDQLRSVQDYLDAQAGSKRAVSGRRGVVQELNESVERRLDVLDRLYAAMASQQAPLREVIALLEPFAKGGADGTTSH